MARFGAGPTHPQWLPHSRIASSVLFDRHGPSLRIEPRGVEVQAAPTRSAAVRDGAVLQARIASSAQDFAAASALVESRYAWRGYGRSGCTSAAAPGVTLIATQGAVTTGTLVLRPDGPAGLAAEESFGDAIDAARARGLRLCEAGRLAIEAAADGRVTLSALIGLAYLVARVVHEASEVFVEVNPRHARFYQRMFGFAAAGGSRFCPRVGAPAVLLRVELERLGETLATLGVLPRLVFRAGGAHALAA
jgi:hypothetical protein